MSCEGCAERVEEALKSIEGVDGAVVDLERAEVLLRVASDVPDYVLADAVEESGYTLLLMADDNPDPDEPPAPAPEPESEPEPFEPEPTAPEPEPPPQAPLYEDTYQEPRSWVPSAGAVWRVAKQVVVGALVVSLVWTLAYRFLPAPFTLLMVSESIFEGKTIRRTWVPLERISPNLVRAVIASEDNEFCRHWGFDFKELQDAWDESQNGGRLRGASTISQQTAKNAFLWPGRSWMRKGLEAYFTVLIEALWPKRRVIEMYLNIVEWGPGIFGAEAASRHWFGKSASRLSPLEAARLAAILPSPGRYRANPPGPYVANRSYTIAARANNVALYGEDRCAKP